MRPGKAWATPISRCAQSTLQTASQSYLVPWFEALLIANSFRCDNTISSGCLGHVLDDFGDVCGHNFASWWLTTGFQHLGAAMTDVQISYPAKRGGRGAHVASFVISLELSPESTQQQLTFLVEQLAHFETGVLSSSPLLWPSFHSALTIQRLCLYLKVLRAVRAGAVLTVWCGGWATAHVSALSPWLRCGSYNHKPRCWCWWRGVMSDRCCLSRRWQCRVSDGPATHVCCAGVLCKMIKGCLWGAAGEV